MIPGVNSVQHYPVDLLVTLVVYVLQNGQP